MNDKVNDSLISDILNSQKPGKSVLTSAKSIILKNNPIRLKIKRQFFTLTGSAAAIIIAGFIFAVLNLYYANYEGNILNSIGESSNNYDNSFLFTAVVLVSVGVIMAVTAIIIRAMRLNRITKPK